MTQRAGAPIHFHGPDNAEHEIRKAYNCLIDTGVVHFWDRKAIPGVNADEVVSMYKHAFQAHRKGNRLAAERWARSAKHLARAFWHEAKIVYLEPRIAEVPYLEGAQFDEIGLGEHQRPDTTADLLDSVAQHIPSGQSEPSEVVDELPENMKRYLSRGRRHLKILEEPDYTHELLRAERIKAAHEYGRVLECLALAYEAEAHGKAA